MRAYRAADALARCVPARCVPGLPSLAVALQPVQTTAPSLTSTQ